MRRFDNLANYIKYKGAFLPIFLIIAVILVSLFFLRSKIFEIFETQKIIKKEKETLADLTKKVAILQGLDEFELTEKTEVLLRVLPPEKDVVNILSTLKALSSQTGVVLGGIKFEGEDTLSLKVQGDSEKIISFMEKIEKTYPLMRLEDVSISFEEEGRIESFLKVKTFFSPLPTKLDSLESPLALITPQEEKIYAEVVQLTSPLTEESLETVQSGKDNPFSF